MFISVIVAVMLAGLLIGVFKFLEIDKVNTILGVTSVLLVLIIMALWGGLKSRGYKGLRNYRSYTI